MTSKEPFQLIVPFEHSTISITWLYDQKYDGRRGTQVCLRVNTYYATICYAWCSHKDVYSANEGRKISLARALKIRVLSKEDRTRIWKEYDKVIGLKSKKEKMKCICKTCTWYVVEYIHHAKVSMCHRHSPPWPMITQSDGCGDWTLLCVENRKEEKIESLDRAHRETANSQLRFGPPEEKK